MSTLMLIHNGLEVTTVDAEDEADTATLSDIGEAARTFLWLADAYDAKQLTKFRDDSLCAAWREYASIAELLDKTSPDLGETLRARFAEWKIEVPQ